MLFECSDVISVDSDGKHWHYAMYCPSIHAGKTYEAQPDESALWFSDKAPVPIAPYSIVSEGERMHR